MDDLLSDFLTESAENLEVIDVELVRFESQPHDKDTLNNIFRLVHTIKGTCGFLGLPRLEAVAHAGETLLGRFRDGALKVTPESVTLVLRSIDRIKELLAHLGATQVEPEGDDRELIAALEAAAEAAPQAADPAPPVEDLMAEMALDPDIPPEGEGRWDADQKRWLRPGEVSLADLEAAFRAADGPADIVNVKQPESDEPETKKGAVGASTIRVNVEVLESLMTMVSELVLTRNQLIQMVRAKEDSEFKAPLQRLSAITGELQDSVMKTRMQPIGSAWKKLPRIVRDTCQDLDKKIELEMEGETTELDRQVLELIRDPLTHMIRNSCDHGVESPEDRVAAGKPATGLIRLRAYHEGGHILIEVADDGAGLKTERIRQKAIERGIVDPSEAHTMTDQQVHRLVFAPGFSTAAKVTNLSGRGVGMDVVKTNVELIGGTVDVRSKQGEGTTFLIKIPLTLAIISALIVGVAGQRFAVPQLSVIELVRAGGEQKIEYIKNTRVLRLRDRLLPLVGLADVLDVRGGGSGGGSGDGRAAASDFAYVVVMQVGETRFGLIVDEVFDTEEIVVKPLSKRLGQIVEYSGATILGDGSVILILDPNGVAKSVAGVERSVRRAVNAEADPETAAVQKMSMLLFRAGGEEPRACPLSLVTRLEDLDASTFESTQRGMVVQYRGKLMPLVHGAGMHCIAREGRQPVLVFGQGEHAIGLAVDEILDIIEERLDIEIADTAPGVLGTAVLKGRSTQIMDIGYFLSQADERWAVATTQSDAPQPRQRVLLVEAHPFFRNLLGPLIGAAGYDVTIASTPEEAMQRMTRSGFDIVVADADAPDFAAKLKSAIEQSKSPETALIPLSSRGDCEAGDIGPAVAKSDRHALLNALEWAARSRSRAA
ncbi:hybrid sensor histidine kinase/response regulator [bacterium]|nr:hybrid sensor histidine kinase/response regulator [bacterium]